MVVHWRDCGGPCCQVCVCVCVRLKVNEGPWLWIWACVGMYVTVNVRVNTTRNGWRGGQVDNIVIF